MIVAIVRENGAAPERVEFDKAEVTIGRVEGNDLVLARGTVSKRHGRLIAKDGRLILVDLMSSGGTYLNGRKITSPMVIKASDKIYFGDFTILAGIASPWPDDADTTPIVEATEIRLLDELARGDLEARPVYADWLDEHGRPDRAELLRLSHAYAAAAVGTRGEIWTRMHALAATFEPRWRLRVAQPVIDCADQRCPGWRELETTERRHIRKCKTCDTSVVFCTKNQDAITEQGLGNRSATDLPFENPDPPQPG